MIKTTFDYVILNNGEKNVMSHFVWLFGFIFPLLLFIVIVFMHTLVDCIIAVSLGCNIDHQHVYHECEEFPGIGQEF